MQCLERCTAKPGSMKQRVRKCTWLSTSAALLMDRNNVVEQRGTCTVVWARIISKDPIILLTFSSEHRSPSGKVAFSKATQLSRSASPSVDTYGCRSSFAVLPLETCICSAKLPNPGVFASGLAVSGVSSAVRRPKRSRGMANGTTHLQERKLCAVARVDPEHTRTRSGNLSVRSRSSCWRIPAGSRDGKDGVQHVELRRSIDGTL